MDKRTDERKPNPDQKHEPTIAPGMEMDELEEKATEEEIKNGDSTSVTTLYLDRI
ncbi:hypothetical protein QO009_000762 [Brevibacillus aydinogluensis]|jgi:hypothetical protein|uniref:YfhD family protein n=1 Tax=Brevibacillus aydinogluensis TaxID=927786 RepID=A0AA48M614_9BACL|nr:hypothetical protein [Brevibacillus aydinogluensis]MDT3414918.1 hypothetical protein [Brevibacillus aydinogluensis]CAJ1001899.1 YfhD family protein [Brevibacillus aydinogluensis]